MEERSMPSCYEEEEGGGRKEGRKVPWLSSLPPFPAVSFSSSLFTPGLFSSFRVTTKLLVERRRGHF